MRAIFIASIMEKPLFTVSELRRKSLLVGSCDVSVAGKREDWHVAAVIGIKTEAGLRVLKDRSVQLSPRQRAAFILIDGKRSLDEVLVSTAGMGVSVADLEQLLSLGLIAHVQTAAASALADMAPVVRSSRTPQQRYHDAYPVATQLTASLGLRGFRLNLAIEAVGSFEQLMELAPKIKQAVGSEKFAALDKALNG